MLCRLLFTFSTRNSDTQTFLERNRICYLVKPFDVAELIATTRRLLEKSLTATASR